MSFTKTSTIVKAPFCENKTLLTSRKGVIKMCIFYCVARYTLFMSQRIVYYTNIEKISTYPTSSALQMYKCILSTHVKFSRLVIYLFYWDRSLQFINYSAFHQNNSFPIIVGKSIYFNINLRLELFHPFVNQYTNAIIYISTKPYLVISALATLILACSRIRRK